MNIYDDEWVDDSCVSFPMEVDELIFVDLKMQWWGEDDGVMDMAGADAL